MTIQENNTLESERLEALKAYLTKGDYPETEISDINQVGYQENAFEVFGNEYLVLTDDEADELCKEQIEDSLWAFNAEFIAGYTLKSLSDSAIKAIKKCQESLCEDANDLIDCLIHRKSQFIKDAISSDGRGHFLSSYDGEENEEGKFFIYRIN